jgi:hypothetical protein
VLLSTDSPHINPTTCSCPVLEILKCRPVSFSIENFDVHDDAVWSSLCKGGSTHMQHVKFSESDGRRASIEARDGSCARSTEKNSEKEICRCQQQHNPFPALYAIRATHDSWTSSKLCTWWQRNTFCFQVGSQGVHSSIYMTSATSS